MSKTTKLLALFLLFSLLISSSVKAAKKLTCATTHYPPYTVFDESKREFVGSDMTLLQMLFKSLDLDVEVVNLPWARLKQEIEESRYDCYFSLGKFPNREVYLDYTSTPIHMTKIGVLYQM